MILYTVLSSLIKFDEFLFIVVFFLCHLITSETMEHRGVAGNDSDGTPPESFFSMSSVFFIVTLSSDIKEFTCIKLIFAMPSNSKLRDGETVILDPRGPMARVIVGVLANQSHLLDPLCSFMEMHGFVEYIVPNIPS